MNFFELIACIVICYFWFGKKPELSEIKKPFCHYFINEYGQLHGEFKRWHTSGFLAVHCFYVNGDLHGEYKEWSKNGKLIIQCTYSQDYEDGKYVEFHSYSEIANNALLYDK